MQVIDAMKIRATDDPVPASVPMVRTVPASMACRCLRIPRDGQVSLARLDRRDDNGPANEN
jgi:hypothetical protein